MPNLAPEPASDDELAWIHEPAYIEHVQALSARRLQAHAGWASGRATRPRSRACTRPSAAVAGGLAAGDGGDPPRRRRRTPSIPVGGLHHAMPARASGFCVYDDPALAIARARRDGLRVMYIDLDVHHGDGVQAIHWADPNVLTVSIHESGHSLFPGTGFPDELGGPGAEGTKVNIPLDPGTGEIGWLEALEIALPPLAAAFRPEIVVSQHGADSPRVRPARAPAGHDDGDGRGGPARRRARAPARRRPLARHGRRRVRRVPRRAAHVGARRGSPGRTSRPLGELARRWRERWAADAEPYGQAPIPRPSMTSRTPGAVPGPRQHADRRAAEIARDALALALPPSCGRGTGSRGTPIARRRAGRSEGAREAGVWCRPAPARGRWRPGLALRGGCGCGGAELIFHGTPSAGRR